MKNMATVAAAKLYSQVGPDEGGNLEYSGDLQQAGLPPSALTTRVQAHLEGLILGGKYAAKGETFAGGRKIIFEILDAPGDLTDTEARRSFEVMVRDQIERFGFTRSNFCQDYMSCSFYSEVRIGRAYWVALAKRKSVLNAVTPILTPAAFRRRLRPADVLTLIAAPAAHRVWPARWSRFAPST